MLPSFSEFQYFLEVSESLNLSRASERLGISQPSLSLAIKRLEKTVGAELLIRHQHGVALTQSGKQLVVHIRKLLQSWQDARSQALASKDKVQGSYSLGCHSTVAIDIVSGFLPKILETYPQLEINVKNDVSRRILERIISFDVDVGILVNPYKHPDLVIRKLCHDVMTFWSPNKKSKILDLHSGAAVIICDPDFPQTHELLNKGREKGYLYDRIITVNSLEAIASMTASGCGIGLLPAIVTNKLYAKLLKPIPDAPIFREELCLVYRNEIRHLPAIEVITAAIKRYCSKT